MATHFVLLILSPSLPTVKTSKVEPKVEKVHLEIIKKTRPPQVHKKKSLPVIKKAVLKTKTLAKPLHVKPIRKSFTQSANLKPASKLRISEKTNSISQTLSKPFHKKTPRTSSPQSINFKPASKLKTARGKRHSVERLNIAFAPISMSRKNEGSNAPFAKRSISKTRYSRVISNSKAARKVSTFTASTRNYAGKAVLVSTRNFYSPSFAPSVRVVKNMERVSEEEGTALNGDDFKEIWGRYANSIQLKIAQAKTYPSIARERKQQGKAFLSFKLDKNGDILELSIENSSGYKILDQAAIRAIQEAAPFPQIPVSLNKKYASLKIPISFVLK